MSNVEIIPGDQFDRRFIPDRFLKVQQHVADQVYLTRKKDDDNPFRRMTYDSVEQMHAALGTAEDNSFIKHVREEIAEVAKTVEQIRSRA